MLRRGSVVRRSSADRPEGGVGVAGNNQVAQRDDAGDLVRVVGYHEPPNGMLTHQLGRVVSRRVVADSNDVLGQHIAQESGGRVFAFGDRCTTMSRSVARPASAPRAVTTTSPISPSRIARAATEPHGRLPANTGLTRPQRGHLSATRCRRPIAISRRCLPSPVMHHGSHRRFWSHAATQLRLATIGHWRHCGHVRSNC
jgi:hypothetical protein